MRSHRALINRFNPALSSPSAAGGRTRAVSPSQEVGCE